MPRFAAIEGLRAWLAWAVVLSHIVQIAGVSMHGGHWVWLDRAGETAVLVFIAISGFVICGLVVDRQEPWPRYILRRAFRIFPAYWIAFIAAFLTLPLMFAALGHMSWIGDPAYTFDEIVAEWRAAIADHPWQQILLHTTLLQGVVPDSVWPSTSNAVLGPAWSLTLEWQFYLVAPALIWMLTQARWRMIAVLGVIALGFAFHARMFGIYHLASFLPGAGHIFLVGIGCRLAFDRLKTVAIGPEVVFVVLAMGVVYPDLLWLAVWLSFYAFLLHGETWRAHPGSRFVTGVASVLLASRPAQYLGVRSYSVYLAHLAIIELACWLLLTNFRFSQLELFFALMFTVIPATLVASELMYRLVERPMIALGARLAGGRRQAPIHAE
jgi:peptidoglycan/LPS O-acetylase OafA/YrhL